MASGMSQMNLGVVVTPYINQQALNGMAAAAGTSFANTFRNATGRAGQPLGRITGQVDEFEKSMAAANARVLAFGASAGSIYLVQDAFRKLVSSTIEVEKALADINVVLGLGQTELKNFSATMFKAAAATGQTFQTASKVALEFARHGVSAIETSKRMVSAMQLMRISGLDAAASVNAITAAINSFNKEGLSSEDVVNRLTAVDTKFAVSAQDLAKAIERVGATAVDAGVKFNELLGLVTAVQTATSRGGAVIGNAFKSIFTRLARPEVLADLEAIGVTTRNASGQIMPMIDILKRLATQYDSLNYAQKSFISEAVGGVYQVNILKASLTDLGRGISIYEKANFAASQSTGLIEKRMSMLNETISAKLNTSLLQMTRLFANFGQNGFGAGAKSGLDSFNKQLDIFASSLDEVSDGAGVGEKIAKSIAQGITKGLGDIAAGPGVQMAANLAAKLTVGLSKFAYKSGREVLGMNDSTHRQQALQQSIHNFLQQNVGLVNMWAKGQIGLNSLTAVYLQQLRAANIMQAQMANASKGAAFAAMPGVSFSPTPASGFVPNFRISSVDDAQTERRLAIAHGYEAGPVVRKVVWDGHGGATLTSINQRETVQERVVNGHRGSIVMPPNGFGEGTTYAANGFVPNFGGVTLDAISSFTSGKKLMKYLRSEGIKGDRGSSRMFIPLDENMGIKIAMHKAGVAQNEVEFPILNNDYFAQKHYADILPKGLGFDENNFLWGLVERLKKPTAKDFKNLTGKGMMHFLMGKSKRSPVEEMIEDFAGNYGILLGDFKLGRNTGIGKIPSQQKGLFGEEMVDALKLIDVGFNQDVANRFYTKRNARGGFQIENFTSAGGHVPNFNLTRLFRGVGGSRIKELRKSRNLDDDAYFSSNLTDEEKKLVFEKREMIEFNKMRRNRAFLSPSGQSHFSLDGLANYIRAHQQSGYGTGLLSTSFEEGQASNFGSFISHIDIPQKRILKYEKLKKILNRFGPQRTSQILMNSSSDENKKKGRFNKFVGFDVNNIIQKHFGDVDSDYHEEMEVALMARGFVPNFGLRCAAIKYNNKIFKGSSHWEAIEKVRASHPETQKLSFDQILAKLGSKRGYLTHDGEFVDAERAKANYGISNSDGLDRFPLAKGFIPNFAMGLTRESAEYFNQASGEGKNYLGIIMYDQTALDPARGLQGGPAHPFGVPGQVFGSTNKHVIENMAKISHHVLSGGGRMFFSPSITNNTLTSMTSSLPFLQKIMENVPELADLTPKQRLKLANEYKGRFFVPNSEENADKINARIKSLILANNPLSTIADAANLPLSFVGIETKLGRALAQKKMGRNKGTSFIRNISDSLAEQKYFNALSPAFDSRALPIITEIKMGSGVKSWKDFVAPSGSHKIFTEALNTFGGETRVLENPVKTDQLYLKNARRGELTKKRLNGLLANFRSTGLFFNNDSEVSKALGLASGFIPNFGLDKFGFASGFVPNFANMVGYHGTAMDFPGKIDPTKSKGEGQGEGFYFWTKRSDAAQHAFFEPNQFEGAKPKIVAGKFDKSFVVPDYEFFAKRAEEFLYNNRDKIGSSFPDIKYGKHSTFNSIEFSERPFNNGAVNTIQKTLKFKGTSGANKFSKAYMTSSSSLNTTGDIGEAMLLGPLFDHLRKEKPELIRPFEQQLLDSTLTEGRSGAFRYMGPQVKAYKRVLKNGASGFVPNFRKIGGSRISDEQILARFREGIAKGGYFADFYKRYEQTNPLKGDDRSLFNKIYASQSRGTDDRQVFGAAIKIFKGLKGGQTDFFNELRPLGTVQGRVATMNKVMAGEEISTEKTGAYYKALSGDPNALAIDRNVIQTALGYTMKKGDRTTPAFRQRLRGLISDVLSPEMGLAPRDIQAALFAGRSKFKPTFDHFISGFSSLASGYIPHNAEIAEASHGNAGYAPINKSNAFALRNIASMMGHHDAFNASVNPIELAEWLSKNKPKMFSKLWMNGMFNFPKETAASGFVPSFSILEAVSQAFKREGTSTAALGAAPELKSSSNPLGLGVYDTAYQKNLSHAFAQHRAMGQTDLKNMGKTAASGFVPNFGVMESLLLGTLQGTVNNLNGTLVKLSFGYNKQLETQRRMTEEYILITDRLKTGMSATFRGKTYNALTAAGGPDIAANLRDFAKDFRASNPSFTSSPALQAKNTKIYESYREKLAQSQGKISQVGMYGMIAGPMAGEIGASLAKNFGYQDLSKGLEVFSSGITTSGQILSTFPNKLGVALTVGTMFKTAADSVSMFSSGFGKMQKNFDLASTRAEQVSSASNALMESFERLRHASTDASVTSEEFTAIQTKHAKLLTELAAVPGGGDITKKLAEKNTDSGRQQVISEAVDAANREKASYNIRMQMAQAQSNSSIFNWNFNQGRGGIFGAVGEAQKLEKQQLLRDSASAMQMEALSSPNLSKELKQRMLRNNLSDEDVKSITTEASKSSILEGRTDEEREMVMKQFSYQMDKLKRPSGVGEDEWDKHIERLNRLQVQETSLRERYNRELQNTLSKGAIIANFLHQVGAAKTESDYRKSELGSFKAEKEADVTELNTADIPMIKIRAQIKEGQIRNQLTRDLALHQNKGAETLGKAFGSTIQDFAIAGQPTNQQTDRININPQRKKELKYLEGRQQYFASNPEELIKIAQNKDTFVENFLGKKSDISSASGEKTTFTDFDYDTLANKLGTAVNSQQENITSILLGTQQITENGLHELSKLSAEQASAIKAARFKELSGAIKGIDELSRGGARKLRRELRRDEYILNHSRSAIRRGEAARDMLNYIPSDQRDRNNPYINRLYNTAEQGSAAAFNYIYRGSSLEGYANSNERAQARVEGSFRGVNMPSIVSGAEMAPPIDTSKLDASLAAAGKDVENFGKSLASIGSSLDALSKSIEEVSKVRSEESNKYNKSKEDKTKEPAPGQGSPFWQGMKSFGNALIPALTTMAGFALMSFLTRGRGQAPVTAANMPAGPRNPAANPTTNAVANAANQSTQALSQQMAVAGRKTGVMGNLMTMNFRTANSDIAVARAAKDAEAALAKKGAAAAAMQQAASKGSAAAASKGSAAAASKGSAAAAMQQAASKGSAAASSMQNAMSKAASRASSLAAFNQMGSLNKAGAFVPPRPVTQSQSVLKYLSNVTTGVSASGTPFSNLQPGDKFRLGRSKFSLPADKPSFDYWKSWLTREGAKNPAMAESLMRKAYKEPSAKILWNRSINALQPGQKFQYGSFRGQMPEDIASTKFFRKYLRKADPEIAQKFLTQSYGKSSSVFEQLGAKFKNLLPSVSGVTDKFSQMKAPLSNVANSFKSVGGSAMKMGGKALGAGLAYGFGAYEMYQGGKEIFSKEGDAARGYGRAASGGGAIIGGILGSALGPLGTIGGAALGGWLGSKAEDAVNWGGAKWAGIDLGVEQANSAVFDQRKAQLDARSKYAEQKSQITEEMSSLREGRYLTKGGGSTDEFEESDKGKANPAWVAMSNKQRMARMAELNANYKSIVTQEKDEKFIAGQEKQGIYTPGGQFSREAFTGRIAGLKSGEAAGVLKQEDFGQRMNMLKTMTPEDVKRFTAASGKNEKFVNQSLLGAAIGTNDPQQLKKLAAGGMNMQNVMSTYNKIQQDAIRKKVESYGDESLNEMFFGKKKTAAANAAASGAEAPNQPSAAAKPAGETAKPQEVNVSTEPLVATIRVENASGEELQTISKTLALVSSRLDKIEGTPKPASVDSTA